MVIEEKYVYKKISKNDHRRWYALCECDDCHSQKLVSVKDVYRRNGYQYCHKCCQKGDRNYAFGKRGPELPWFGLKRSKASCLKISRALKGKLAGEKHHNFGKHLSPEIRLKIGEAQKDKIITPQQKKQISKTLTGRYRGEESPHWKSSLTTEEREKRRSIHAPELIEWRTKVFQRDGYMCQVTGENTNTLNAHHLYNWADYPDQRYDIKSGITLDKIIHRLFHCIYGVIQNTPEQFEEFRYYMTEVLNT